MDIWEANAMATSIAPHVCNQTGLYQCTGDQCAFDGVCDKWGCGYNPYALGNKNYYGPGLKVDTRRTVTVVTQFPAENGKLKEIRRLYVQDGRVIQNAVVNVTGSTAYDSLNDDYCSKPGAERFMDIGGMEKMGGALSRGMVLIFSIWWDTGGFMNWLDSGNSGPCNATEGDPKIIQQIQPDPAVTFSQIKWGEIGSTFSTRRG
jgi:cellulase